MLDPPDLPDLLDPPDLADLADLLSRRRRRE